MGQHAKRFTGAQKGTALQGVVDRLKDLADHIEEHYDANSLAVGDAMQRFEMGLNRLKSEPEREQAEEDAPRRSSRRKSTTPKSENDAENASDES